MGDCNAGSTDGIEHRVARGLERLPKFPMHAFYLEFIRGPTDNMSFVGRQPTHLPLVKPWPTEDDPFLGFFMQLWVENIVSIPGIACLQFYQPLDSGDDPRPVVVPISRANPLNQAKSVSLVDRYGEFGIDFETREEPVILPAADSEELVPLLHSKFGGHDPWRNAPVPGQQFLGQIMEHPAKLNFGGTACVLYVTDKNEIMVEMR